MLDCFGENQQRRNEPQMFPPRSGNVAHPGRGFTLPLGSTLTGYLSRWPLILVTWLETNCSQFCCPMCRTCLMHSRLSGLVKLSSMAPICSAHKDILYPKICRKYDTLDDTNGSTKLPTYQN